MELLGEAGLEDWAATALWHHAAISASPVPAHGNLAPRSCSSRWSQYSKHTAMRRLEIL